jgi:hypothetical protein
MTATAAIAVDQQHGDPQNDNDKDDVRQVKLHVFF